MSLQDLVQRYLTHHGSESPEKCISLPARAGLRPMLQVNGRLAFGPKSVVGIQFLFLPCSNSRGGAGGVTGMPKCVECGGRKEVPCSRCRASASRARWPRIGWKLSRGALPAHSFRKPYKRTRPRHRLAFGTSAAGSGLRRFAKVPLAALRKNRSLMVAAL